MRRSEVRGQITSEPMSLLASSSKTIQKSVSDFSFSFVETLQTFVVGR